MVSLKASWTTDVVVFLTSVAVPSLSPSKMRDVSRNQLRWREIFGEAILGEVHRDKPRRYLL
jgi:hypothetical protein